MTAILGYITLALLVYLIMKGNFSPSIVFIGLSVILGLVVGYDLVTLNEYIKTGVISTASNAVMFAFAILFFTIMTEAGLFDPIVDFLMRTLGRSVFGIGVAAVLVSCIGHLDGSATTTALVTIPFFLPAFKRIGLQGKHLMLLAGLSMGVMNLMPWAGPLLRASVVTGIDPTILWRALLPAQIFGLIVVCGVGVYFGRLAKRSTGSADLVLAAKEETDEKKEKKPITWKWYFNLALLIAAVVLLAKGTFVSYIVFQLSCVLAMVVNFRGSKAQNAVLHKAAGPAYYTIIILFSAGVFMGVLGQGEPSIISQMATALINILPPALARHLHIIMGAVSTPLGLVFASSAYDNSVLPLCVEVGARYGISAQSMAVCMAIGKNVSIIGSPVYPSTFLILGLCETELKDYLKFAFIPMWALGILMILFSVLVGTVPF